MSSRSTSFSAHNHGHARRPSVASRLSFAVSAAEQGEADHTAPGEHRIEEEIAEIKRYEDFTTIDWVQDAAREQARQRVRRREVAGLYDRGSPGLRQRLLVTYDAIQGWLVITLIGAAIGLNAALLSVITEWLADFKLGYCKTAFYLNENFCCWGEENGCDDWKPWTGFAPLNYIIYILFAIVYSSIAAILVRHFAPYAAGSGISEIKCIIAGFVMKGFLGPWTLLIKSVALPLAIGSGLSVGKEGPSVHYAVCTGNVISRFFNKYKRSATKTREILCACAAAGVAVAFGSPIGGVLFSLEEMAVYFPLKTLWRSYFCALVATAVLAAMNPFRTGQLVMFQVSYDRSWQWFEIFFFVIIGIFGGLYGALVIKWNLRAQGFRKKYLANYAVLEATLLAAGTAVLCYPNAFLRIEMTESMEVLFLECEGEDYHGLCDPNKRLMNILSLTIATALRVFLVIISYGCKVPAGIFVPSMAIGALFGRTVGIIVEALHAAAGSDNVFFRACPPDGPCITPGTYAFLGSAAALSGIMHITISVVVIMFELTGALTYILPTMIVVGVTKAVSELFGKGGIADRAIWFSGYPYLDAKEEHNFGVPVSRVMTESIVSLPVSGLTLGDVENLLADDKYQGFPIVSDENSKTLVGYIGRTELRYALERLRATRPLDPSAPCTFSTTTTTTTTTAAASGPGRNPYAPTTPTAGEPASTSTSTIALGRYVDPTPVTAHPRLPLETVMELFRKIGPRVILIEYHGKLTGLVTVKDCLKYQFKVEAAEHPHPRGDPEAVDGQERLWEALRGVAGWVSDRVERASRGRIQLRSSFEGGRGGGGGGAQIMDGDEELDGDDGVELSDR
ncbi:related to chloride channel [Cephalotrichum gorgonifer]|uniref:Chloride channel protein n=1 Tax=Cephalotrichum gorgonifer TaxID=2041049 RepID=A0AAE8SSL3_9PEZI|nr:related to chloride channel [Cephalotrichum gorgonifer]